MIIHNIDIPDVFALYDVTEDLENFRSRCKAAFPTTYFNVNLREEQGILEVMLDQEELSQSDLTIISLITTAHLTDSLAQLKLVVNSRINEMRDAYKCDRFVYDGKRWDCSDESIMNIIGTILMSYINNWAMPPDSVWRDYDNNNWPVTTGTYMLNMGFTLFFFLNDCYRTSWIHKYYVGLMTTATEVKSYDYTVAWPVNNV